MAWALFDPNGSSSREQAVRKYSQGQPLRVNASRSYAKVPSINTQEQPAQAASTNAGTSGAIVEETALNTNTDVIAAILEQMRQDRERAEAQFKTMMHSATTGRSSKERTTAPAMTSKTTALTQKTNDQDSTQLTLQQLLDKAKQPGAFPTPHSNMSLLLAAWQLVTSNSGPPHHPLPPTPAKKMQPADYSGINNE
ncbi:hypothetical protein BC939DRAFT_533599 [Gamsiella multidivaricata]|uniref:uncharacterized protein n=1 Tax=Gamsiella multidivaricata TaxID=101098 RepID=UPI002220B7B0|nr:uncharacterized protein BC939DRAFT_533599 [Gamsiella multidivaricata]KAI7816408.1 hypothetical protein BC939DRAFT_533599 [Gamsiella multidivaricata]